MNVRKKGQKWYKGFSTSINQNAVRQESSPIPIKPGGPQDPADNPVSVKEYLPAIAIGNYPNPCDLSTLIHYVIANDVNVTLIIQDINGREVLRPMNEIMHQAGPYAIQITTSQLPAGNYLYTIRIGTEIITRSFTVIH
jgi:hypothetical protein